MNRLPRRSVNIQPPLRGRLAAVASPKLQERYAQPTKFKRPSLPRSSKKVDFQTNIEFQPPELFGKRLIGLIILILLLLLIGSQF
jgi:hypothetical protein